MPRNRLKLAELAQRHWCLHGEQVVWAEGPAGHVGSTVGTTHRAPHAPIGQVPAADVSPPEWPLPTSSIGSGQFYRDEWAHDPAIWGWAHANQPAQAAVRWADLFATGRDEGWLLLSNRRLAIVIETRFVSPEPPPPGGLLGRVRTRASEPTRPPFATWWEAPVGTIHRFTAAPLGRLVQPEWFVGVEFRDGSAFSFRDPNAEQSVRTAYANLRTP